jgi:hypothetical protein
MSIHREVQLSLSEEEDSTEIFYIEFNIYPYISGKCGHFDFWMPDEGGYAEIRAVYLMDGKKFIPFDENKIPEKTRKCIEKEVYDDELRKKENGYLETDYEDVC